MEKNVACDALSTSLEAMQVSRKLDETAFPTIQTTIEESKQREDYWISSMEITPQIAFVMYHAARTTRIVLEKMYDRFMNATKKHDNPKVVDDAIAVYPEVNELCHFIDSLQKAEIPENMAEFVRRRTRNLRNTAQKVSMFPSTKEELQKVNKDEFAKEFSDIATDLRLNLV